MGVGLKHIMAPTLTITCILMGVKLNNVEYVSSPTFARLGPLLQLTLADS